MYVERNIVVLSCNQSNAQTRTSYLHRRVLISKHLRLFCSLSTIYLHVALNNAFKAI